MTARSRPSRTQIKTRPFRRPCADILATVPRVRAFAVTKLATLLSEIAHRLDVKTGVEEELEEVKRDVAPERVLDKIEKSTRART
jgi:hypothetical protein